MHSSIEVFQESLKKIYDVEHVLLDAQEKMVGVATNPRLKLALEKHIDQTKDHIDKLEKVFHLVGLKAQRGESISGRALVQEAEQEMAQAQNDETRDVIIGMAVLKAEHVEIAAYEALIRGADIEGVRELAAELQEILEDELETAAIAKNTAPELLKLAAKPAEGQGLLNKAKEKLTG